MADLEVSDCEYFSSSPLNFDEDSKADLSESQTDTENPGILEVNNKVHDTQQSNVLCRDFFRGFCVRPNCKFVHDPSSHPGPVIVNFCHDYQNKGCSRSNCKFIHCSISEEETYRKTGKLIVSNQSRENHPAMSIRENMPPGPPLGQHPFCLPPLDRPPPPPHPPMAGYPPHPPNFFPPQLPITAMDDYFASTMHRPPLQPRNEEHPPGYYPETASVDKKRKHSEEDMNCIRECEQCLIMEKENSKLQEQLNQALRKNAQLEKENDKLKSANEFLLDQTATLRGYTKQVTLVNANNSQSVVTPQIIRGVGVALTTSQDQYVGSASSNVAPQQILVTTSPRTQILEVTPSPQFLTAATSQQEILNSTSSHSQLLGVNASQAQLLGVNSSQPSIISVNSPQPSQLLGVNVSQPQYIGVSAPQQIIVTNSGQRQLIAVGATQQSASAQQQITNIANINGQLLSSSRQIISSNREQRQIINANPDQIVQTVVIASQGQALVQPSLNSQLQLVAASPADNSQGLSSSSAQSVVSYPVSQTILH